MFTCNLDELSLPTKSYALPSCAQQPPCRLRRRVRAPRVEEGGLLGLVEAIEDHALGDVVHAARVPVNKLLTYCILLKCP